LDGVLARFTGDLMPPISLDEFLSDRSLRFWYRATIAPGLPPDFDRFGDVPCSVWGEFLYIGSMSGG